MAAPAPPHPMGAVMGFFIDFQPAIIPCTLLAELPKTRGPQVPHPDPAKRMWLLFSDASIVLPLLILTVFFNRPLGIAVRAALLPVALGSTAFPTRNGIRAAVKENAELRGHVFDELERRRRKVLLRQATTSLRRRPPRSLKPPACLPNRPWETRRIRPSPAPQRTPRPTSAPLVLADLPRIVVPERQKPRRTPGGQ